MGIRRTECMEDKNEATVEKMLANFETFKAGKTLASPKQPTISEVEIFNYVKEYHGEVVRTRDEIHDEFVKVVNCLEPDNTHADAPYPLSIDQFEFSYCRNSSSIVARCGPRSGWSGKYVFFAADKDQVGRMTDSKFYALLIHEATHIEEGCHTPGSSHNPTFWNLMADNVVKVIQSDEFDVDPSELATHARNDPNNVMTDRRMMTVEEQRQAVEDRILRQV